MEVVSRKVCSVYDPAGNGPAFGEEEAEGDGGADEL